MTTDLPETTRFRPRPVVRRETQRMSGRKLEPPSEAEKADAIEILRDGPDFIDEPWRDYLYAAAERIFMEASE
jgi:hypothetical protein